MNQLYPQGGVIPRSNASYPMANMQGVSSYAAPLNYNQPKEVVSGYDARINPMTGQEIPQTNFAGGGLTSLVNSPYRDSDVMQVKMTPREVAGLQQLAMAYGATPADLYDPVTGQPQFSFLKKILPMIAGAVLPSIPGVGQFAKTIGFGSQALGTSLLVGGVTGLVEGDLKKGLMAGLGAYSGAKISEGLGAAASKVGGSAEPPITESTVQRSVAPLPRFTEEGGTIPVTQTITSPTVPVKVDVPAAPAPVSVFDPITKGIPALLKPEGRTAFMDALGGGLSKSAVFMGAMDALTPQAKALPTGAAEEDLVYIHGGRNPQYGTGRDQPYYLPGQYYKRTDRGLVPYNPFQLAPGYGQTPAPAMPQRGFGPRGRGFADGGAVQGPINIPAYAAPTNDPNVLATRAYIEELNRRVRAPITLPSGGDTSGRGGLGSFGGAGLPITDGVGGGGVGGAAGPSTGDIVGGIASSYLINKGIEKGIGAIRDRFFPGEDQLQEVEVTGRRAPITLDADLSDMTNVGGDLSSLSGGMGPDSMTGFKVGDYGPALDIARGANVPALSSMLQRTVTPTGLGSLRPTTVADAVNMTDLSSAYEPSGSIASRFGGMRGALDAGAGTADAGSSIARSVINRAIGTPLDMSGVVDPASLVNSPYAQLDPSLYQAPSTVTADLSGKGLGSLKGKIVPGLQTALGAYQTAKAIEAGKEGRAAFSAAATMPAAAKLMNIGAIGGPAGMLAAAAIAAIGASLVKTDEMGAVSLRNYWRGIDEGRGIGQSNPQELAEGFINFYRTGKNNFPGLAKYGKKGNEDFVYDMTQVINDAVKSGKVSKDVDAPTMFKEVVQPWLNTMGEGPSHPDARRVQDFMMTDLIHNFMQGAPISNAQVKGDKKFKIVSDRPIYAGIPPALNRTIGGNAVPNDVARKLYAENNVRQGDLDSWAMSNPVARMQALGQMPVPQNPFAAPEERATIMPVGQDVPIAPPLTREQRDALVSINTPAPNQRVAAPYVPPDALTDLSIPGNIEPVQEFVGTPYMPQPEVVPISPFEAPVYVPREESVPITPMYEEPVYIPREEPAFINPYAEERFMYAPESGEYAFAAGGAIGEDYNFGFAQGGRPMEYRAGGKFLQGPGDGMSDDIKANIDGRQEARLADGEFVIPADVVSHLGNGSSNAGAKKLHQMMARVRQARTGRKKQAPAVKMDRYLPA